MRSTQPFLYLARNEPKAVYQAVTTLELPGVEVDEEPMGRRVAPQSEVGSTVVGFTGVDDQGLAGIEYQFNSELAGKAGSITEETDAAVRPIPFGSRIVDPAQPGDTVVLTIDRTLQFDADQILARDRATLFGAGRVRRHHARAHRRNSRACQRARFRSEPLRSFARGRVAKPSGHRSRTNPAPRSSSSWRRPRSTRERSRSTTPFRPLTNCMWAGGSSTTPTTASWRPVMSEETVDDIVTFSHNVGAAEVTLRLGKQTMFDYIRRYGFDDTTGVDLPGESAGIVGTPDDWWGSRLATIGFGQGVSVTPLALARAYAAVANGGVLMRPLLVRYLVAPDGRIVASYQPQVMRRVMAPQTAASLLKILRDVVQRGTAKGLALPGYALAGKTGTAQMVIDGQLRARRLHRFIRGHRARRQAAIRHLSEDRSAGRRVLWEHRRGACVPARWHARCCGGKVSFPKRRPPCSTLHRMEQRGRRRETRRARRETNSDAARNPCLPRALFEGIQASVHGDSRHPITSIATDSRLVQPGALFFCLRGERADGRAFAGPALAAGAVAIVADRPVEGVDAATVVTSDPLAALSKVAARFYDDPSSNLTLVGVTGTNGKTTTAHFIEAIAKEAGEPFGLVGTLGARFGDSEQTLANTTPLAHDLQRLLAQFRDAGARGAVLEVSSHALDLHRVDDVHFDVAVFTNLTHDHLDFHKSFEDYRAAKRKLFAADMGKGGVAPVAVLNPTMRKARARALLRVDRHARS